MKLRQVFSYLRNPRRLRWILLAVVILTIFSFIRTYHILVRPRADFQAPLICLKCRQTAACEVTDLSSMHCAKCNGKMAFLYKCDECLYEFPYTPKVKRTPDMKREEYIEKSKLERRCPNCNSLSTHKASFKNVGKPTGEIGLGLKDDLPPAEAESSEKPPEKAPEKSSATVPGSR